LIDIICGRPPA